MNQIIFRMRFAVLVWMLFLVGSLAWAQAPIYRCGKAYQAEPCDGGKLVDTRPQMSAPDDGSDMETIYLCESYQGAVFWTNTNCYGYRPQAMLKRTVKVPRNLSWDDKVAIAAGARRQADALQSAPRVQVSNSGPTQADKRYQCEGFRQALRTNESASRVGGTAARMEWLAEERRDIIRRQQGAGCG